MNGGSNCNEDLVRRLPLPLAQLYRRAHNAKNPLDRHLTAFDLWEAALKLLGSAAIMACSERDLQAPELSAVLTRLARPTLGDWWRFVYTIVPILADAGDEGFRPARDLIFGRERDDMPRATGLDVLLREVLENSSGTRVTVRLRDLFERLVCYRNRILAHGAPAQRLTGFHDRMGGAILLGVAEILERLDVLAGRRLLYVADARLLPSEKWVVELDELIGEVHRRLDPLERDGSISGRPPSPGRVYLQVASARPGGSSLTSLHPLVVYEPETGEALFLNARRGRQRSLYLCYSSGRELELPGSGSDHSDLLRRVLRTAVDDAQVERWSAESTAEEGPAPDPTALPSPARSIAGFDLLTKLGQGGMGVVYRAWQPSVGRQVALKRLLRTGDAKADARFAREIRALGRVEHPNLVKIFTSGSEGEDWFYAMELVDGTTLADVQEALASHRRLVSSFDSRAWQEALNAACESTRNAEKFLVGDRGDLTLPVHAPLPEPTDLPPDRLGCVGKIVELLRQVSAATQALHEKGVIHRDIKPGNIMVSPDGSRSFLMDLGLAQLADEMEGKLTRTRHFVGTLRYASPEQILAVDRLDGRSDVYSLGVTLWELLTLRPLYGATERMTIPALMSHIQFEEPERVQKYVPGIDPNLEAIVLKCLEKNPRKRYQTAGELAEDLGRFQSGRPTLARPIGSLRRGLMLVRRRSAIAALLGVNVFVVFAAIVLGAWLALRPAKPEPTDSIHGPGQLQAQDEILKSPEVDVRGAGLDREMSEVAEQVKRMLEQKGLDTIAVGDFRGPARLTSSSGPAISKALAEALKRLGIRVHRKADLEINGDYRDVEDKPSNRLVIMIKAKVVDRAGEEVVVFEPRGIFNAATIAAAAQEAEAPTPTVVITLPVRSGQTVTAPRLEVKALAKSRGESPVTSLRLLLDGRPYPGQADTHASATGEVEASWVVDLEPGSHQLAVLVESARSQATSAPVEVTYEVEGAARLPSLYVLAIGISDYPGDLRLQYATKDAEAIDDVFRARSSSLYKRVEVKRLTDQGARRKDILAGLTWLRKQMTQKDVGVIFFSGHGMRDGEGSLYLLPVDADVDDLLASAVSDDQLKKALAALPGRVIALLDACHAGNLNGERRKGERKSLTDDLVRDLVSDDYGVVVMASSTGREFSLESNQAAHGIFTMAIVEGLSGAADYNRDGVVYLNELDIYIGERVKVLSNGQQHPVTARPASVRSFPLSKP